MVDEADKQLTAGDTAAFWSGVRAALPLWLGITPYGLAFGLLGRTVGLGAGATMAMSLIVFAGSAQFIGLGLMSAGASSVLIVLTTLVINLRHMLYAASLAPYLGKLAKRWKPVASFFLTDEAYATVIDRFQAPGAVPTRAFYMGVCLALYVDWNVSTAIGLALGGLVPDPGALGLDFALPATFIGFLVPLLRGRAAWVTAVVAGVAALALSGLPGRLDVLTATILAATAGWGVETWLKRS